MDWKEAYENMRDAYLKSVEVVERAAKTRKHMTASAVGRLSEIMRESYEDALIGENDG